MTTPRSVVAGLATTIRELRGDGRGWVLLTIAFGWLFVLGTRVLVPTLLPQVTAAFDVDYATAGAVLTLLWAAYAITQFPAGLLIDRIGERATLLSSLTITIIGAVIFVASPSFVVFTFACILFGLGTGLYAPPRVTVLSRLFPDRDSTALGIAFASGNIGAAILPVLATTVAGILGWRFGFGIVIPPLVLVGIAVVWFIPTGTGGRAKVLAEDPAKIGRRLRVVATNRTMLLAWTSLTLVLFTYQGLTSFLPTYFVAVKGFDNSVASLLYGLFFASGAVSQYVAGDIGDRFQATHVLAGLSGLGVLTLAVLPFVSTVYTAAVVVAVLGTRLGLGSVGNAYVASILPDDIQGAGYGLFRTVYLVVGSLGSMFVGVLSEIGLFDEAFLVLAAITGVAAVLFLKLPRPGSVSYRFSGSGDA